MVKRPPPPGKGNFMHRLREVEELSLEEERIEEETLHHEEVWLVSYADLMTLLFGFFVILFSMSKLDDKQFEAVRQDTVEQFGGQYQLPTESVRRDVVAEIQKIGIPMEDVQITQTLAGLEFDLKGGTFFASGSAELTEQAIKFIDSVYASLAKKKNQYVIRVEGHTDDVPISTAKFPSNWELSSARAVAVIRYFEAKGWDASLLEGVGYGASRPLVPNRTESGQAIPENMAKNRRILIKVTRAAATRHETRNSVINPVKVKNAN